MVAKATVLVDHERFSVAAAVACAVNHTAQPRTMDAATQTAGLGFFIGSDSNKNHKIILSRQDGSTRTVDAFMVGIDGESELGSPSGLDIDVSASHSMF